MSQTQRFLAVQTTNFEQVCDALNARNALSMSVQEYHMDAGSIDSKLRNSAAGPYNDTRAHCYLTEKGWHIILLTPWNIHSAYGGDAPAMKLSVIAEVINFGESECITEAKAYRNDNVVWSITHDYERGSKHLATSGKLPECFNTIRDKELRKDNSQRPGAGFALSFGFGKKRSHREMTRNPVQMSRIPINVVSEITGHRHGYGFSAESIQRIEFD